MAACLLLEALDLLLAPHYSKPVHKTWSGHCLVPVIETAVQPPPVSLLSSLLLLGISTMATTVGLPKRKRWQTRLNDLEINHVEPLHYASTWPTVG